MKSINFLLLVISLALSSCTDSGKSKDINQNPNTTLETQDESFDNSTLHLNNGAKWTVNEATHLGMTNIQNLLAEFLSSDNKDYVSLATSMSAEASTLISKCDMTGIEHDQLHLILHPILGSIDVIKQNGSMESLKTLSEQLNSYFNHFQIVK